MAIRVLYVHHAGVFGGASRSLLDLFTSFPPQAIDGHLITQRGAVARLAHASGMSVLEAAGIAQFDHTRYGFYCGRRWLLLLREAAYMAPTFLALLKARWRWPAVSLVHLNEVTLLPALVIVKMLYRCPIVIHIRSVQLLHSRSFRARAIRHLLRQVNAVIAIDETVRRSLPADLSCEVIHNGLRITISHKPPRNPGGTLRVGMVGNLLGLKGVVEFVEAAAICKAHGVNAQFVIFGDNTRPLRGLRGWLLRMTGFAPDIERDVLQRIREHGLQDRMTLAGFQSDLNAVYGAMDVVCFPSHLDAPGRPVFEAAFWSVPAIVAVENPTEDTLVPGETGINIKAPDPQAIADAVGYFCSHPQEVERMGLNARRLAEKNFDAQRNALKVLAVYRRVLGLHGI